LQEDVNEITAAVVNLVRSGAAPEAYSIEPQAYTRTGRTLPVGKSERDVLHRRRTRPVRVFDVITSSEQLDI
jgi:hypothetical protein